MKKIVLIAAFIAGLVGCDKILGTGVTLPPQQYDHPYRGTLIVQRMPIRQIADACHIKESVPWGTWACAVSGIGFCRVIFPRVGDLGKVTLDALMRHEIGHCNGWPANHPGGHY